MGKVEMHSQALRNLDFQDAKEVQGYLVAHSNLPGPRGSLELAEAFAGLFITSVPMDLEVLISWAHNGSLREEALEFIPFCSLQALGAAYTGACGRTQMMIEQALRLCSCDARWRLREAAAMALQRIGEADFMLMSKITSAWLNSRYLLELRAVMAALAHPPILMTSFQTEYAINAADRVLGQVAALSSSDRKSEDF